LGKGVLSHGDPPAQNLEKPVLQGWAVRFGSATAGISVTRPGTAPSMPSLAEIEAHLPD